MIIKENRAKLVRLAGWAGLVMVLPRKVKRNEINYFKSSRFVHISCMMLQPRQGREDEKRLILDYYLAGSMLTIHICFIMKACIVE